MKRKGVKKHRLKRVVTSPRKKFLNLSKQLKNGSQKNLNIMLMVAKMSLLKILRSWF